MAKRGFSSGLQAMKFMQRGRLKEEAVKQDEREEAEVSRQEQEHDQNAETSGRCAVIMEGDPRPGATIGRMSFKNFNPEIDRLQEDIEARKAQARVRVAAAVATATVATTSVSVKVQHRQQNDNDDKGKAGTSTSAMATTGSDENPARKKLKAEPTQQNKHRQNSNKHNTRNRFDALQGARFRAPPKF